MEVNDLTKTLSAFEKAYNDYEETYKASLVTEGTKAFIQGDLKAQKALNLKLKFNLVNKEALKYIKAYKKELAAGGSTIQGEFVPWLKDKSKEERAAISKILEDGYKAGKATGVREYKGGGYPKNSIAADLQEYFRSRRSHAALVARTEIARIQSHGSINRYKKQSIKKVMWLVFNPCPICSQYARRVYDIDKLPREIPVHPNCFLPGTLYEAPGVVAGLRAFYSGQAVKLTLANGASVAVTENHFILTSIGFARANQLCKGDYIVYGPGFEREVTNNPNNNKMISRVEDIFNALIMTGSMAAVHMPVSAEDLHGDGQAVKGNIDIVRSNSFLRSTGEAPSFEHTDTDFFNSGPLRGSFNTGGPLAEALEGLMRATDGGMSSTRKPAAFFGRRLSHTEDHSLRATPWSYTGGLEAAGNDPTVTLENLRECLNRHTGIIEFQEITDINIFPYHGPVYDFETISTLSIGNGFITSNCRCAAAPVADDVPTGPAPTQEVPEVFERGAKALPPKYQTPGEIRKQISGITEKRLKELETQVLANRAKMDELYTEYDRLKADLIKNKAAMTADQIAARRIELRALNDQLDALDEIQGKVVMARAKSMQDSKNAIRELLYIDEGPNKKYYIPDRHGAPDLTDKQKLVQAQAQEFYNHVLGENIKKNLPDLELWITGRRSWTNWDNIIRLEDIADTETLVHETAHNIEFTSPGARAAANDYLKRRTQGEKAQKLRDVTGINFRDDEVTKVDKFINPYVGKIYDDDSTEVLSMGTGWLYSDPAMLAEKDPELFDLVVNAIRGNYDYC